MMDNEIAVDTANEMDDRPSTKNSDANHLLPAEQVGQSKGMSKSRPVENEGAKDDEKNGATPVKNDEDVVSAFEVEDDDGENSKCGIGAWHPRYMQVCVTL